MPGPGSYNPVSNCFAKVGGIISKGGGSSKTDYTGSLTPGPGSYAVKLLGAHEGSTKFGRAPRMSGEHGQAQGVPGPGAYSYERLYNGERSMGNQGSKFGSGPRDVRAGGEGAVPGPGMYYREGYDRIVNSEHRGIAITKERRGFELREENPGPGVEC